MKTKRINSVSEWARVQASVPRQIRLLRTGKRSGSSLPRQIGRSLLPPLPKLPRGRQRLLTQMAAQPDLASGPAVRGRIAMEAMEAPSQSAPPELVEQTGGAPERWDSESKSALTLYMREVGEVPLLTPEQEIELARRVQAGDEQAREHMIRANLRLVVKIAREYENLGLPLVDLINEGNIGLMKAVERFDPKKGAKLSSYSSWWIRQSIRRALANQGKTIRLPVNAVDQICHLKKAAIRLRELLGREPTEAELAEELGLTVRRVNELREAAIRPASLDAPLSDEDSSTLLEVVPDERAEDPYQVFEDRNSLSVLGSLVDRLPERERTIIQLRFGLKGGRQLTLEEIGAKFNLTRERIRQLQNLALHKLRRMLEDPEAIEVAA